MINCDTNEGDPVQSIENEDDATVSNDKPPVPENTFQDSYDDKAQAVKNHTRKDSEICDSISS